MSEMTSLIYFYLFLLISVTDVLSNLSTEDCKSLGYNQANLFCSTCDRFKKFELNEIFNICKECCLKDEDDNFNLKKWPKAVLEVCTCKFAAYPQIQAFIKSDRPNKYKNLQIRYVRGLDPVMKLYDAENKLEDILDIHKWNTDSVDEFLITHLLMD
ncbi:PREDICTED: 15 kDa selenoprotein [Ceratosolen solmsi marchali]|uniref:Selenoprotein F n=1 Tax=Ceratosolen solmsi marchali TaxID=326594 RepID=A0AAJ7DZW4_9HYME|nr:PREDICTED: 15 kDa selenoprotein [Ceratosolen solmsi marchali]